MTDSAYKVPPNLQGMTAGPYEGGAGIVCALFRLLQERGILLH